MLTEPCTIILQGEAGASVYGIFATARKLAGQTEHDITVVGNDVRVVVTPQMDDEQCRNAYTRALREREREREKPPQMPEIDDRAKQTYSDLETDVNVAFVVISRLSQNLGRWHSSHQDPHLRAIASDADALERVARRIKRLAEEQVERP